MKWFSRKTAALLQGACFDIEWLLNDTSMYPMIIILHMLSPLDVSAQARHFPFHRHVNPLRARARMYCMYVPHNFWNRA